MLSENAKKITSLFSDCEIEKSFVADYNDKIKIKAKPDLLSKNILIDLKTTSKTDLQSDYSIAKTIKERKYHRQLGFYKLVLEKLGVEVKEAILIFVDTTNYWVRGVRLKEIDLQIGMDLSIEIIEKYNDILENGLKISSLFSEINLPNWEV